MTLTAERAVALPWAEERRRWWERAWSSPVRVHLLAVAVLLVLLVPVVGTSSSFLADEGAAVIQGRSLAAGQGWIVEHPATFDPGGDYYPLVNSERGDRGFAPLAKHPAYPLLLAAAHRVGGVAAMVLLSVAGTVLAAGLAAALARRLDPVLARPTVWAVAVASPLLFDGYLILAHTLGAALVTAAVLVAVVAITERRPVLAAGVAPCVAGAVLLRNEALLAALALGLVAGVLALRRDGRVPAAIAAGSSLLAAVAAHALETMWVARIVGRSTTAAGVTVPAATAGILRGRADGFLLTWLAPGYGVSTSLGLCLLAMAAALVLAVRAARRAPASPVAVLAPAFVAAAAAVAAVAIAPANIVPGLLLAFPLATAGLVALRRSLFAEVPAALAGATAALFALAVLATQYPSGGTGEWGGRYFALAVPVAVPVLLLALHRQGQALQPLVRRGGAIALVVCSAALSVMGVNGLRANHEQKLRLVASVDRALAVAGPLAPIVTTWSAAPRFAWPMFDRTTWLRTPTAGVAVLRERMEAGGIDRFVFVTSDVASDRPALAGLETLWADTSAGRGREVLVLRRPAARP